MKIFKILISMFLILFICGIITVAGVIYHFNRNLPDIQSLKNYNPPVVTRVYSDNGELIGEYYKEKRIYVHISKIPEIVKNAFIAAEDENFYHHKGLDIISIIRALLKDIKARKIVQGGSTITQQVVKSFLLTPRKTFKRKIREIILSYKIENFLNKEDILNLYLNQIYLGYNSYGVAAAAENYFGKTLDSLTLAEAAMLAGLPKAPSLYSPANNFTKAKERQLYVLKQMEKNKIITHEDAVKAFNEKIVIKPKINYNLSVAPYFLDYIRDYMIKKYGEDKLYTAGFKIYTSVDLKLQNYARTALRKGLENFEHRRGFSGAVEHVSKFSFKDFIEKLKKENKFPINGKNIYKALITYIDKKNNYAIINVGGHTGYLRYKDNRWISYKRLEENHKKFISKKINDILNIGDVIYVKLFKKISKTFFYKLYEPVRVNGAILSVIPKTGLVKAMVGGYSYSKNQFNRAYQAKRLTGSGFKPIIYAAAFAKGLTPATVILDTPEVFYIPEQNKYWKPENYEKRFYGPTTLRDALVHSRNVVTVKLLKKIGIDYAINFARKLKITSQLNHDLSMALGSSSLTLLELVRAYSIFANKGNNVKLVFIKKIIDRNGKTIENNFNFDTLDLKLGLVKGYSIISPQVAYLVTSVLEDVVKRGTGRRVRSLNRPCAGKTGTTNDYKDAWFFGYTPDMVTGVYVGYDRVRTLGPKETGSRAASPIWLEYMKKALSDIPPKMFPIPTGIIFKKIDIRNGLIATSKTPSKYVRMECFIKGTEPKEFSRLTTGRFIKNEIN
jgi:penicillin-binding protein 1A